MYLDIGLGCCVRMAAHPGRSHQARALPWERGLLGGGVGTKERQWRRRQREKAWGLCLLFRPWQNHMQHCTPLVQVRVGRWLFGGHHGNRCMHPCCLCVMSLGSEMICHTGSWYQHYYLQKFHLVSSAFLLPRIEVHITLECIVITHSLWKNKSERLMLPILSGFSLEFF